MTIRYDSHIIWQNLASFQDATERISIVGKSIENYISFNLDELQFKGTYVNVKFTHILFINFK